MGVPSFSCCTCTGLFFAGGHDFNTSGAKQSWNVWGNGNPIRHKRLLVLCGERKFCLFFATDPLTLCCALSPTTGLSLFPTYALDESGALSGLWLFEVKILWRSTPEMLSGICTDWSHYLLQVLAA